MNGPKHFCEDGEITDTFETITVELNGLPTTYVICSHCGEAIGIDFGNRILLLEKEIEKLKKAIEPIG
jgi:hypothetical protein